jgi:hypothetical protein
VLIGVALGVFLLLNWTPLLPSTWSYFAACLRGERVGGDRSVSESIVFMGRLYGNMALHGDATPWWFFPAFATVKLAPLTALLGWAGVALAVVRRRPAHRLALVWLGVFLAFSMVAGGKYGRFFLSVMPAFLLLAGHAAAELAAWVAARLPAAAARLTPVAAGLALLAPEALAAVGHAPHYRLYVNALGGGDARVTWFLPHCDYFDAGLREAIAWVARHAEPGAEVVSEVDWTVRFYSAQMGRADLVSETILPDRGCRSGRPCYVLVQPGRLYRHNQAALERLARATPVFTEWIRGEPAARVYRLGPGEPLFPPPAAARLASP